MDAIPHPSTDAGPPHAVLAAIRGRLDEIQRQKSIWPHDFPCFAAEGLVIRSKDAAPRQFRLNSVQRKLDQIIENQKAETGMARAIVVKARQLGISTYVSGRFYHRTRYTRGIRCNIMTHRDDATRNLMGMVKRFYENDPDPPDVALNNADTLTFAHDSGFTISTAGALTSGAGRSFTFQLAHLSEMALWQNPAEHLDNVLNAVPHAPDTEVLIESTAQGASGPFYAMAMEARRGEIPFELVFLPWHEHDEYRIPPPEGWQPGPAVAELAELYDLDRSQLYWAEMTNTLRARMEGLDDGDLCWRFRQEYPSNIDEAFRAGRKGGFIPASTVAAARRRENPYQADMPLILGCDFATGGGGGDTEMPTARSDDALGAEDGDANVFISHRGRAKGRELYERFRDRDTMSVAARLQAAIDRLQPARVFMDRGGGGAAVYDILAARGYGRVMELVDFGTAARPADKRQYRNKRAEMYGEFRRWLADGGDIPDDDELEAEITAPWVAREDEQGLLLAPKREIRAKLKMSPDGADACVLCHAATVRASTGRYYLGGSGGR